MMRMSFAFCIGSRQADSDRQRGWWGQSRWPVRGSQYILLGTLGYDTRKRVARIAMKEGCLILRKRSTPHYATNPPSIRPGLIDGQYCNCIHHPNPPVTHSSSLHHFLSTMTHRLYPPLHSSTNYQPPTFCSTPSTMTRQGSFPFSLLPAFPAFPLSLPSAFPLSLLSCFLLRRCGVPCSVPLSLSGIAVIIFWLISSRDKTVLELSSSSSSSSYMA